MWSPRSLTGRLVLAAATAVVLPSAVATVVLVLTSARGDREALDRELRAGLATLRPPAQAVLPAGGRLSASSGKGPPPAGALDPGRGRVVRILDSTGAVARAEGAPLPADFPRPVADGRLRDVVAGGRDWRTAAVELGDAGTLEITAALEPLQRDNRERARAAAVGLLAVLGVSAVTGTVLGGLALKPLSELRAAAAGIGTRPVPHRVPVRARPAETAELGRELNDMLDRLRQTSAARDEALAVTRRFTADAGHELRTPLASLMLDLQALDRDGAPGPDRALTNALAAVDQLAVLVDQLEALARGEAGRPSRAEDVDLGEVADAAVAAAAFRHPALRVALTVEERLAAVPGDPGGVRRILDNLLENAARHAGPAASVAVAVTASGSSSIVVVEDDGPGIPVAERTRVLGRFARGANARGVPGSGLGLAIVAAEARRHGGGLELSSSPLGGLRATVRLSAADPQTS